MLPIIDLNPSDSTCLFDVGVCAWSSKKNAFALSMGDIWSAFIY